MMRGLIVLFALLTLLVIARNVYLNKVCDTSAMIATVSSAGDPTVSPPFQPCFYSSNDLLMRSGTAEGHVVCTHPHLSALCHDLSIAGSRSVFICALSTMSSMRAPSPVNDTVSMTSVSVFVTGWMNDSNSFLTTFTPTMALSDLPFACLSSSSTIITTSNVTSLTLVSSLASLSGTVSQQLPSNNTLRYDTNDIFIFSHGLDGYSISYSTPSSCVRISTLTVVCESSTTTALSSSSTLSLPVVATFLGTGDDNFSNSSVSSCVLAPRISVPRPLSLSMNTTNFDFQALISSLGSNGSNQLPFTAFSDGVHHQFHCFFSNFDLISKVASSMTSLPHPPCSTAHFSATSPACFISKATEDVHALPSASLPLPLSMTSDSFVTTSLAPPLAFAFTSVSGYIFSALLYTLQYVSPVFESFLFAMDQCVSAVVLAVLCIQYLGSTRSSSNLSFLLFLSMLITVKGSGIGDGLNTTLLSAVLGGGAQLLGGGVLLRSLRNARNAVGAGAGGGGVSRGSGSGSRAEEAALAAAEAEAGGREIMLEVRLPLEMAAPSSLRAEDSGAKIRLGASVPAAPFILHPWAKHIVSLNIPRVVVTLIKDQGFTPLVDSVIAQPVLDYLIDMSRKEPDRILYVIGMANGTPVAGPPGTGARLNPFLQTSVQKARELGAVNLVFVETAMIRREAVQAKARPNFVTVDEAQAAAAREAKTLHLDPTFIETLKATTNASVVVLDDIASTGATAAAAAIAISNAVNGVKVKFAALNTGEFLAGVAINTKSKEESLMIMTNLLKTRNPTSESVDLEKCSTNAVGNQVYVRQVFSSHGESTQMADNADSDSSKTGYEKLRAQGFRDTYPVDTGDDITTSYVGQVHSINPLRSSVDRFNEEDKKTKKTSSGITHNVLMALEEVRGKPTHWKSHVVLECEELRSMSRAACIDVDTATTIAEHYYFELFRASVHFGGANCIPPGPMIWTDMATRLRDQVGHLFNLTDGSGDIARRVSIEGRKTLFDIWNLPAHIVMAEDERVIAFLKDFETTLTARQFESVLCRHGGLQSTKAQGKTAARGMGFTDKEIKEADAADLRFLTGQNLGFTYGSKGSERERR